MPVAGTAAVAGMVAAGTDITTTTTTQDLHIIVEHHVREVHITDRDTDLAAEITMTDTTDATTVHALVMAVQPAVRQQGLVTVQADHQDRHITDRVALALQQGLAITDRAVPVHQQDRATMVLAALVHQQDLVTMEVQPPVLDQVIMVQAVLLPDLATTEGHRQVQDQVITDRAAHPQGQATTDHLAVVHLQDLATVDHHQAARLQDQVIADRAVHQDLVTAAQVVRQDLAIVDQVRPQDQVTVAQAVHLHHGQAAIAHRAVVLHPEDHIVLVAHHQAVALPVVAVAAVEVAAAVADKYPN